AEQPFGELPRIVATARNSGADVLLLAGDTFDHVRMPVEFFRSVGELLAEGGVPVVLLPANHDPLFDETEERWTALAEPDSVTVLGLDGGCSVNFPDLGLEIVGRAHRGYGDVFPLPDVPERGSRWLIGLAHGHFTRVRPPEGTLGPSWLFDEND